MKVVRETCIAGRVIDVTVRVPSGRHTEPRAKKRTVTAEKVQKNNDRMAIKKLARIINANFDKTCWHDTITYAGNPTPEEAKKKLDRCLGRIRYRMKKRGLKFKWVVTTEWQNSKLHHHLITNAPVEIVRACWKEGHILPRPFDENPNYYKLAEYIIKETSKSFREKESPFGSRYSHSRGLIIPTPNIEEVDERQLFADPKPREGYYIDWDTVRRFEHPITGLEHLEYMMISIDEEPRIKKYYKGKPKKREENYRQYINYEEEQQSLWK